ncbi:carabin isoform X2 [Dermochelys coriacea]|uniref:carabin isoform X2 n=1 Tax=Dermochelys coriacea TaxID=27794 RepID=UPI0018E8C035|nr:carabin isoform X2 [Dermochelys coriacea]
MLPAASALSGAKGNDSKEEISLQRPWGARWTEVLARDGCTAVPLGHCSTGNGPSTEHELRGSGILKGAGFAGMASGPMSSAASSSLSTLEELSDAFDSALGRHDDSSSLGSDSELNGAAPYRQTDRYGFFGTSGAQDGPAQPPVELVRHRENRWLEMTSHWEKTMARRYKKVKVLCRKGIPSSMRARCWPLLCGGQASMTHNQGKYKELEQSPGDPQWLETIEKDIHRQFPFHEMFLSPEGHGQRGLLQLLKAYTVYRPREGYCQAQGPVAAVLLMHMPAEQAFWCLVQISERYLPGYYSPEMEAVLLDGEVFVALLQRVCPKAYKHLRKHGVGPLLYVTEWFLCLYSRTLPFPTVLRIWDAFLSEGVKVLFRVGLVLVRLALGSSEKLRDCTGVVETLEKLRSIPVRLLQEDTFMAEVYDVAVSDRDVAHECRIQLAKLCKVRPDFGYRPEKRLPNAKAIFDAQQLEDAQQPEKGKHPAPTFLIPEIVVDPPPPLPKEQRRLEKERLKEQRRQEQERHQQEEARRRQEEAAAEKQARKKKPPGRKKPDTRGKTFHVAQRPMLSPAQGGGKGEEPGPAKRNSVPYLETYF